MLDAFKAVVLGSRVEPSTKPVHPDTSMGPMGMSGGYMGCVWHTGPHDPMLLEVNGMHSEQCMIRVTSKWHPMENVHCTDNLVVLQAGCCI